MKKEIFQEIEIPEGVETEIKGNLFAVRGNEGENSREFNFRKLGIERKGNKVIIGCEKATKNEKKIVNTIAAHINNMVKGVQKKFEYKLKICSGHFPMTVISEGNTIIVKNFLGEKVARKIKMPDKVDINIGKDTITISSVDKEKAGQAAANFENVTKIKNRDKRVFQDGIYIINKDGREI